MQKRSAFLVFMMMLGFYAADLRAAAAQPSTVADVQTVGINRQWIGFYGIGIEITFGTNIPGCPCCYGGICGIKANIPLFIKKGPMDDEYIASQVRGFLPNDQGSIGTTSNGEVYLLFNRDITRPDFQGSKLEIKAAVNVDPALVKQYNIPEIPAGSYDIVDNGLFKMIRIR